MACVKEHGGGGCDLRHRGGAALPHGEGQLRVHDVQNALHSSLAKRSQTVDVRAANADGARSQSQGFVDIGSPSETAVDENRYSASNGVHNLGKTLYGRPESLQLATPVI